MIAVDAEVAPQATTGPARARDRAWAWCHAHPYLTVAAAALVVRGIVAVIVAAVFEPVLMGDEALYISMARWLASGEPASTWVPDDDYGDYFLRSTALFTVPLRLLYEIGVSRPAGQALAGAYGTGAALVVLATARRLVRPAWALAAALLVALLPSQVLFSSVVLRESAVWTMLALSTFGVVLSLGPERRDLLVGSAVLAGALVGLAFLRDQTLIAVAWATVLAVALARSPRWLPRLAIATGLALVIPTIGGAGIGGWSLVNGADLGSKRALAALEADSGFTPVEQVGDDDLAPDRPIVGTVVGRDDDRNVITGFSGDRYAVDTSLGATIRAAPRGAVAFVLRPFPWEIPGTSSGLALAGLEGLVWLGLYAGAVVGAARVGLQRVLLHPILVVVAITAAAAVSQGNLGTAFRHRGQLVGCLALLTAVGGQALVDRHRATRPGYDRPVVVEDAR